MSSTVTHPPMLSDYRALPGAFDELLGATDKMRATVEAMVGSGSAEQFARTQALAEAALLNQGVTFSVYSDARGVEKIFPVCLLPRVISASEWDKLERGLQQRVRALEAFVEDVYADQRILEEGAIPAEVVLGSAQYLPAIRGVRPPAGVRIHISGIDLIRDGKGVFRVLEDNLRTPSGVSYVLENRLLSKRLLARAFEAAKVRPVNQYPARLAAALRSVSPAAPEETTIVVLTPGPHNSAYFEHSFLARQMGVELVEAADLFVDAERLFLQTIRGPKRVHVVYRRTDDAFLDPEVFRPDSMLGVRGLMRAWARGNVALANAPGNGVADDKGVYPFVPEMVRFYLGEEPLLAQVPTYQCARPDDRAYVLEHLAELVVKVVDEAGGYGMLMGPTSTAEEREEFRRRILAAPRRYIAQPRIELSTCPTWVSQGQCIAPRRVDFRPFVLNSADGPWVLPGGLTRVALREGSYVVNSSQGGGSKDTWVLKGDG
ncbi:MAG: circularly permuted type 2 ATP-grasp protein [Myxococcaceae bacterium]